MIKILGIFLLLYLQWNWKGNSERKIMIMIVRKEKSQEETNKDQFSQTRNQLWYFHSVDLITHIFLGAAWGAESVYKRPVSSIKGNES